MNITDNHGLFYASKKSKIFKCNVSIHDLINSQVYSNVNSIKHNNITQLIMVYKRCKRNDLNFKNELLRLSQSGTLNISRLHLYRKIAKKLNRKQGLNK